MSIKLVAIDIDGTLVNNKRELTTGVRQTLLEAHRQGCKVVLCTGRPLPGVQAELDLLELTGNQDYVITYNGSLVQNIGTKEIIFAKEITKEDYLDIEYMSRKLGVHLHVSGTDAIYTANRNLSPYTIYESMLVNMPIKYRTQEEMTDAKHLQMIKTMMIDEPDILDAAIKKLPAEFKEKYTIVKSAPFYLEVLNKEANKGTALHALAEHLGFAKEELMAIGDNENDLTMIEYAGTGVAMQNAIPLIKEHADYITEGTNDQDGVAEAVKKFVLQ